MREKLYLGYNDGADCAYYTQADAHRTQNVPRLRVARYGKRRRHDDEGQDGAGVDRKEDILALVLWVMVVVHVM